MTLEDAKRKMEEMDEKGEDRFGGMADSIVAYATPMLEQIGMFLKQGYPHCQRGIFGAFYYDWARNEMEGTVNFNRPSAELLSACWSGETCLREQSQRNHGSNYDTCPAIHALEGLPTPLYPESLLWVEAGGRPHQGWSYWGAGEDLTKRAYPCLQCLRRAAWMGIEWGANIAPERDIARFGEYRVGIFHIPSHATFLMHLNGGSQ